MRKLIFIAVFFAALSAAACSKVDEPSAAAAEAITYNGDADLWTNRASLSVRTADGALPVVEYRRKGSEQWVDAPATRMPDGSFKALILPRWIDAPVHASGVPQYQLDPAAGVFAGSTYEYRLVKNGAPVAGSNGEFETAAGQIIPGGDMETWSLSSAWDAENSYGGDFPVSYPNVEGGEVFWTNGNNAMTLDLCTPLKLADDTQAARLKGKFMFITFAAGNLFSGIFDFVASELSGYARFGQKYSFTARPSALKVRYKSTITNFTYISALKKGELTTDMLDKARIFVCITDWTDRHSVMSGFGALAQGGADKINAFDPEVDAATSEGKIQAYGSIWIDASTEEWVELTIPILYKSKTAKPAAGNYSLVISCASSAFGDYLCGSENNELLLDAFEWVY